MARLATAFSRAIRPAGRYETSRGGIVIPVDQSYITARITRTAWVDLGPGGRLAPHRENNGRVESAYGGLDTEVMRLYLFLSEDAGATWIPWGMVGSMGGNMFNAVGDLIQETTYSVELPERSNPDRLVQAVLRCRAEIDCSVVLDVDERPSSGVERRSVRRSLTIEDSQGASATSASSVATANLSPANNRRYLTGFGGTNTYPSPPSNSGITFGSTSLTNIWDEPNEYDRSVAEQLIAPSTTAAAVTQTFGSNGERIHVGAIAFSDVDQTTPRDTPAARSTGGGSPMTHTVSEGDAVDVRVCSFQGGGGSTNPAPSVGSGETSRVSETVSAYSIYGLLAVSTKTSGSDAFDWTITGGGHYWQGRGFNINEDLGAGGATSLIYNKGQNMGGLIQL